MLSERLSSLKNNFIWVVNHPNFKTGLEYLGYLLMIGASIALGLAGISEVTHFLVHIVNVAPAIATTLANVFGVCAIITNGLVFCRGLHEILHGKDEDKKTEQAKKSYWMEKFSAITGNKVGYAIAIFLAIVLSAATSLIETSATLGGVRDALTAWHLGGIATVAGIVALVIIFPLEFVFAINEIRQTFEPGSFFKLPELAHQIAWYFGAFSATLFALTTGMAASYGVYSLLTAVPVFGWVLGGVIALGSLIPAFIATFQTVRETIGEKSGFLDGFNQNHKMIKALRSDFLRKGLSMLNGLGEGAAMISTLRASPLLNRICNNAVVGPVIVGALLVTLGFAILGCSFFKRCFGSGTTEPAAAEPADAVVTAATPREQVNPPASAARDPLLQRGLESPVDTAVAAATPNSAAEDAADTLNSADEDTVDRVIAAAERNADKSRSRTIQPVQLPAPLEQPSTVVLYRNCIDELKLRHGAVLALRAPLPCGRGSVGASGGGNVSVLSHQQLPQHVVQDTTVPEVLNLQRRI